MEPLSSLSPKIMLGDDELVDEDDIFRGERRSTLQTPDPSVASLKSGSAVSSGSFRLPGGRFGALATRLERAITRWARKNWADSSSTSTSSTSSSSRSSFRTANKSKSSRRKRRLPSLADMQQLEQTERTVAARIRAREISRAVPREFNLYSPPPPYPQAAGLIEEEQQVVRAFSLDVVLPHLERVLRNHGKAHRPRHRSCVPSTELGQPHPSRHLHPPQEQRAEGETCGASQADALEGPSRIMAKRKDKIKPIRPLKDPLQTASTTQRDPIAPQAWWLDVASPSWEDMRSLGRLLHLHPLTLEDILQQESREKLELFPKLGYYFIVLRAIESSTPHGLFESASQNTGASKDVSNEICIYVVVFRDGICTFHFSNISEHLDRVRGKLQTTAQSARKSSAWIAHGILDSVVDSFFPLVDEIGEHVMAIENAVYSEDSPASTITPIPSDNAQALRILHVRHGNPLANARSPRTLPNGEKSVFVSSDEKRIFPRDVASVKTTRTQFLFPKLTLRLILQRMRRALTSLCRRNKPRKVKPTCSSANLGLYRIARTRHLATSVAGVLATKLGVVAAIRKRLLAPDGLGARDDLEVAIYFGDVQDHILTLQQSLEHYERMLRQSHPMYLQSLRIDFLRVNANNSYKALMFALVTVVVLPPNMVTGAFTLNVKMPRNNNGEYWLFGVVILGLLCIQGLSLVLTRYWWVKAMRRYGAPLDSH
ncbi:hypothetical protein F5148DRAFT_978857 [Russula earlei]|uniref:Uncharacterized protein n=1 Tax=Russula earlei TaxID=71964 RepID=A0ACC0UCL2_9AGAM|nr:hypothetical protein F5148DRAFT_978857 [Russula earlei]